ncbi:CPBP family intramembrane glutamic endopeptidase [Compostimonas suwonensis]|uniref:CAAX prenyl protease-like protein n=1 Tax=Compostimonas suwonensis TaxID=1048394 RepID=A0A2M9BYR9_9MICO|nr:CPBP family intramembrane glutamic endopeptidase [Compostimonas suwonensis]PJJ63227.1 CAAX prenyl protease-like protein [Compostimonas suwonensis]
MSADIQLAPAARGTGIRHYAAGVLLAVAAVLVFGFEQRGWGYAVVALGLVTAWWAGQELFRDLWLIAFGLLVMSAVPITTDIAFEHMLVMGAAMIVAVAVPYLVSRYGYRDHAIRFPVATGKRWTRAERWYLPIVVVIAYFVLPVYLIGSGVYENWPAVTDASSVLRLFIGTNALGIWDELFFICTAFTLLRRHYPFWAANLLQAVLFTAFLYELGFRSWGPLLIFPFALVQAYIFRLTKSLSYIVSVHLLFDAVLFLVLVHAHNREWFDVFVY